MKMKKNSTRGKIKRRKQTKKRSASKRLRRKFVQRGGGNIPNIVHQIWFGSHEVPTWRQYLFDLNKTICERNGYTYKLWRESDRAESVIKTNFVSTWGYQRDALKYGKELEQSRWAQVADLARLEIIYTKGGIYLDSLFEISDAFLQKMTELSNTNKYIFIGANEDPCGLDCKGYADKPYVTNSFFAAPKFSPVLERLLSEESLDDIDLKSPYINRTTGPYFLREGIKDADRPKVFLFEPYTLIYPFNVNTSDYREEASPNICLKKTETLQENETRDFIQTTPNVSLRKNCLEYIKSKNLLTPTPLVIYHSGLGGTWSW